MEVRVGHAVGVVAIWSWAWWHWSRSRSRRDGRIVFLAYRHADDHGDESHDYAAYDVPLVLLCLRSASRFASIDVASMGIG
jgi:hypothetical protein